MSLPDTEWLNRLKAAWSCPKRCAQPEMVDQTVNILKEMRVAGIKKFVCWWLPRFHELPARPDVLEQTTRAIIRLWIPPHLGALRTLLRARRYELVVRQTNYKPQEEKRRLMDLEAILIRVLLADWFPP